MAGNEKVFRRTKGPRWKYPSFVKLLMIAGAISAVALLFLGYQKFGQGLGSEAVRGGGSNNKVAVSSVRLGIENLDGSLDIFKGKRVGLITNATGVDRKLRR